MRFITLNENNKIVGIRYGSEIAAGEIESEAGELGQLMLEDGRFIDDPTPPEPQPPSEVEFLKQQVFEQNQTLSELLDLLFTHVPELSEL